MVPPRSIATLMGFSLQSLPTPGEGLGLSTSLPLLRLPASSRASTATSRSRRSGGVIVASAPVPLGNQRSALPAIPGSLQGVAPPGGVVIRAHVLSVSQDRISPGISPLQGLSWRTAAGASTRLLPRVLAARAARSERRGVGRAVTSRVCSWHRPSALRLGVSTHSPVHRVLFRDLISPRGVLSPFGSTGLAPRAPGQSAAHRSVKARVAHRVARGSGFLPAQPRGQWILTQKDLNNPNAARSAGTFSGVGWGPQPPPRGSKWHPQADPKAAQGDAGPALRKPLPPKAPRDVGRYSQRRERGRATPCPELSPPSSDGRFARPSAPRDGQDLRSRGGRPCASTWDDARPARRKTAGKWLERLGSRR